MFIIQCNTSHLTIEIFFPSKHFSKCSYFNWKLSPIISLSILMSFKQSCQCHYRAEKICCCKNRLHCAWRKLCKVRPTCMNSIYSFVQVLVRGKRNEYLFLGNIYQYDQLTCEEVDTETSNIFLYENQRVGYVAQWKLHNTVSILFQGMGCCNLR